MTLIIAEAGVNHNGDMKLAHQLIKKAAEAGADIVKFQTFQAKRLSTNYAEKANYQKTTVESTQQEMLEKLELKHHQHLELIQTCKKYNVEFLSTGFDIKSLSFLDTLNLKPY